jgi:superfamily I DNA/RNA helicase
MNYTKEQINIFDFIKNSKGHGIIDAVAGAGKTTTIVEGAKHIINPNSVLFCAFNKFIATELKSRFINDGLNYVEVKTIHALGFQILRNHSVGNKVKLDYYKYNNLLKSNSVQKEILPYVNEIVGYNGFSQGSDANEFSKASANRIKRQISSRTLDLLGKFRSTLCSETFNDFIDLCNHYGIFKDHELTSNTFKKQAKCYFSILNIVLSAGLKLYEKTNSIDFTDMLYLPYKLKLNSITKYDFIFIDECQDLSKSQFAIATKYGKKEGRILAVGDPKQSIYGFTGADVESFERIKKYTQAKQLPLTKCFRCPSYVIAIAKSIRQNITGIKEETGIVNTIYFDDVSQLVKPNDLIICRSRAPLISMLMTLLDQGHKLQVHPEEANEIIGDLKSIFNQKELNIDLSVVDFDTIKGEIIRRAEYVIKKKAKSILDPDERSIFIINENLYLNKKIVFIHQKIILWKVEKGLTILGLLKKTRSLITVKENAIKIFTIHRSKGLEANRVFILNYEQLPNVKIDQKKWEKEQELNLKYVAVTRAKEELYLVKSEKIKKLEDEGSLFDYLPFDLE